MQTITSENYDEKISFLSAMMEDAPEAGTPEADELQELAEALEAYEQTLNLAVNAPVVEQTEETETPTHVLFYKNFKGKSHEKNGTAAGLRKWAKKEARDGNIGHDWEVEKL